MNRSLPTKKFKRISKVFFSRASLACLIFLSACQPSDRTLIEKAEKEVINQRAHLARYLFLQVAQNRKLKDDIRLRALKGLAEVSKTQLFEYPAAAQAYEKLIEDFENDVAYGREAPYWRIALSELYRNNLENPERALKTVEPLLAAGKKSELTGPMYQEIARVYLSLREYEQARIYLQRTWDWAKENKSCELLRATQLDMIQTYTVTRLCEKASAWMDEKLPSDCIPASQAILMERAYCFELTGESPKAAQIYEDLIQQNPSNQRAHMRLEGIIRRMKEKQRK